MTKGREPITRAVEPDRHHATTPVTASAPTGGTWTPDEGEVEQFEREGFIVVRGLLSDEEISRFGKAARQMVEDRRTQTRHLDGWEKVFLQEQAVWRRDVVLRDLSLHAGIGAAAARLVRTPVRLFLDQVICKYPGDLATLPHQDAPFLSYDDRRSVNAWIALSQVTPAHGALSYYRGSHGLGLLREVDLGTEDDDLLADAPQVRDRPIVEVPAQPGDVVFHHCLVVHQAGPNMTGDDRIAFSNQYMPEGARYNGWEHEFLLDLGLALGDALTSPAQFPAPAERPATPL